MSLADAAEAFTRSAIYLTGDIVTFQRLSGAPPNVVVTPPDGAAVTATVRSILPDTTEASASGYSASQIGSITQGDRLILVMSDDLANAGFPVPLQKGDQAILASTGEVMVLTRVDAAKRSLAGCIEAYGTGVA